MKILKRYLFLPVYYAVISVLLPFCTTLFIPASPPEESAKEETISVFNHVTNLSENMILEDYLIGVVAAEMPAAFESEALKAQAVAARTYTFYKSRSNVHTDGDICTDSGHCQAYLTDEQMRTNWGTDYDLYFNKIKDAVYSTQREHLTYNEEPVMAVFHSMGGGKTENSQDVWGSEIPYLISVDSPGEEVAVNYNSSLTITFDEFKAIVLAAYPNAALNSFSDVSVPVLSEGGHVKSIIIGAVNIPGTAIRSLFNLRSTKFTISFNENNVTFNVTGYGHGVGMSQYGANAMAKEGKDYKEILSHYYPGTTLYE